MKKRSILDIFLITLPIIDLFSSLTSRWFDNFISVGMIIKGLAIFLSVFYVLILSTSRYKKVSFYYYLSLLIYIICYFGFKPDLLSLTHIGSEINYIFKYSYFPIMTFGLINYFDDRGFDKKILNKIMLINLVSYIILIIGPTVLNLNFKSYSNSNYYGSVGWYYSANEISTILLLLFPFIYIFLNKNKFIMFILYSLSLFMISLIGTKVTLFGIILLTFLVMITTIFSTKKIVSKNFLITMSMFIVSLLFMLNNNAVFNFKTSLNPPSSEVVDTSEVENIESKLEAEYFESSFWEPFKKYGSILLSSRDVYALNTYYIFDTHYRNDYILFGMGFSNSERISDLSVEKLIEIDFLDVFFHMGLIAVLIFIFPFIYVIYIFIEEKNKNQLKFNSKMFFYIMIILLTVGISSTAGHVYLAPAVSIYITLYFVYLLNEFKVFEKSKIDNNKVAILALHMGYGGVENVISNVSSFLADDYDVEIISLYKKCERIPFKINKNVKVKYLFDTTSNKEEFLKALQDFRIIEIFKQGVKACYILFNKNLLIKKYIVNSDAKVIISTRMSFSKILNKYGRDEVIKIHQEHTYSVSNQYINKLNSLFNIDYIMPVSNTLVRAYKKKIDIKMEFIPLALNYYPDKKEISNLGGRSIIAIGRLEKEKAFDDLLYVMAELVKVDPNIYLNLIGDGSQFDYLQLLIKDYNLEDNVKMWGYRDYDFIKNIFSKSSLYVMTSLEESFGLVVLEAMSFGIPCIAFSSAEGVKDIINRANGYIVKDRNKSEMIEIILKYFSRSNSKKKKMGIAARLVSEKYEASIVRNKWLKFMKKILKEKT